MELRKTVIYLVIIKIIMLINILAVTTDIFALRVLSGFCDAYLVVGAAGMLIDIVKEIKKDRHPPMTYGEYMDNLCKN